MVLDSKTMKNKAISLPKFMTLNNSTEQSTSFNDTTWGDVTRARMEFVNNSHRVSSLEKVIAKAKAFVIATSGGSLRTISSITADTNDQLVDLSDDEGECKHNTTFPPATLQPPDRM